MTNLLLQEIDEEVRRDRLAQIWARHGRLLIGLSIAFVVLAAAYSVYLNNWTQKQETATAGLVEILQNSSRLVPDEKGDKKNDDGKFQKELIDYAGTAPAELAMLARLYAASQIEGDAQRKNALDELNKIVTAQNINPLYQELAKILSVQMRLDQDDPAALQAELAPLMKDTQPWRHSARELSALLSYKMGDKEAAKKTVATLLGDEDAPESLKERAKKLESLLNRAS